MSTEHPSASFSHVAQPEPQQVVLPDPHELRQGRDQLLEATANAANILLTLENFNNAINAALKIIAEASGCDRIKVLENGFDDPSSLPKYSTVIYEWARPDFLRQMACPESRRTSNAGMEAFMERHYLYGDGFGGLLEDWDEPLRGAMATFQVQSAYSVPIWVNGQWWGILALNYCRAAIQISSAEVAVLRTIANCIGSAIQRDRTRTLILKAEQERVAELVRANAALKQSLDTLVADPDLDRFIGHTLKLIAHEFDAPLIEYWVHSDSENTAYIHLTYWQGKILRLPEQHNSPELTPFLDILLSVGYSNIGALAIYLPSYRSFSRQTIELAHALAQQLTLAIELTRLAEESRQSALLQERTRMAREIHDTLAQAFGGILMQLQAATYFAASQPDKAQSHLLTAQTLAKDGLTEARRSVWTLYLETTEYEDPAQTIVKFIQQTTSRQSVPIQLAIEGTPYRLHPDLGLNLLRIAQEAITNALRHAQAQAIQIHLSYSPQALQLTIRDDGCGFDPQLPARGFGLAGMQQRAAHLGANWHLISQLGQGTTITVTLMG